MPTQKQLWTKTVIRILKTELAKRDITYSKLKEMLEKIGVNESEANIKNKLSRGTFSAIFFMQCMRAIGVQVLVFDEAIFDR